LFKVALDIRSKDKIKDIVNESKTSDPVTIEDIYKLFQASREEAYRF